MFCKNCGNKLDEGSVFCTACGTRVAAEPITAEDNAVTEQETQAPAGAMTAEEPDDIRAAKEAAEKAVENMKTEDIINKIINTPIGNEEEAIPLPDIKKEKPERVFGMGAFIFCIILIGLLSVSTGIFAGLYFSLR